MFIPKVIPIIFYMFCLQAIQAQDTLRLSLTNALDIALTHNNNLKISGYHTEAADYGLRESNGNFMPKITVNGSYNRNIEKQVIFLPIGFGSGGPTRIGANNNYNASLDLSLPLYSSFNISNRNYAKTNLELQLEALRGTRLAIINNVKKTYVSYQVAIESVIVMEKTLEHAEQNLRDVQQLLAQGRVTDYDEMTAKVKIATAKNNLLQSKSNIIPTLNAMKNLLGLNENIHIITTQEIALPQDNFLWIEFPDSTLQKNSDIRQKEISASLTIRQVQNVKSGYYPSLNMIGNYQYISQQDNFDFSQYQWVRTNAIGLQLQVPLYKGFTTRNKVNQAIISQQISQEQIQYTKNEKKLLYQELISRIQFIKQRLDLQKENIDLAQKALFMARERYAYGIGTLLEVNDSELSVTMAKINWLQAMLDYKLAYYDYELLTGKEEGL
jgi:outer membrane protein